MATAILAHAAARAGGDADAEMVRQGPGGYRKITDEQSSNGSHLSFATSSSATATAPRPTRSSTASAPRSRTASSSSSSGPRAAASPRCCAWSRAWRKSAPARSAIGERVVNNLEPAERDIAMVFQNYALYPHMTRVRQHGLRPEDRQGAGGRDQDARRQGRQDPRAGPPARRASRASSRAASASAWPWAAPSCASRRCSCSTSRCPTSTPSCAPRPASRSRSCTASWASPRSSSRTTRSRR